MPKMPLCGGFKIGVDIIEPKMPPFVIVNVPPVSSSICSAPLRARSPKSRIACSMAAKPLRLGVAQHGHDEPAVRRDGHADVEELVIDDVVAVDGRVQHRVLAQRLDRSFDEERHEAELDAVLRRERLLIALAQRH